jgi:hypothetical protein
MNEKTITKEDVIKAVKIKALPQKIITKLTS